MPLRRCKHRSGSIQTTQQPRRSGRSQAQYSMDLRKKQGGNDGKAKILPAARRTL
nr:MAG TPA_asm: hypothetical protein [Bacteriophage sp.]DAW41654.1 MAG TPA: hypothetical protein [Caudoviricetes sp.]DAX95336.1 MAG TPA: hypothetical protein [Caudoviricetes sp.]